MKIWLTYMIYKKRLSNNEVNYATAAWLSEQAAMDMRDKMLDRSDVEDVFIQVLYTDEAPQDYTKEAAPGAAQPAIQQATVEQYWPEKTDIVGGAKKGKQNANHSWFWVYRRSSSSGS